MKDWIMELCPEIAEWQAEMIEEQMRSMAPAELRRLHAENEKLKEAAMTAEKWRSMALAKEGDGRTVQTIQDEARDAELEACAQLIETFDTSNPNILAAAIRSRKSRKR